MLDFSVIFALYRKYFGISVRDMKIFYIWAIVCSSFLPSLLGPFSGKVAIFADFAMFWAINAGAGLLILAVHVIKVKREVGSISGLIKYIKEEEGELFFLEKELTGFRSLVCNYYNGTIWNILVVFIAFLGFTLSKFGPVSPGTGFLAYINEGLLYLFFIIITAISCLFLLSNVINLRNVIYILKNPIKKR